MFISNRRWRKRFSQIFVIAITAATIVGLSDLIFISSTQQSVSDNSRDNAQNATASPSLSDKMEKINLLTTDKVKIAANLFSIKDQPKGWIVFSHMMPATKDSWNDLAVFFQQQGYESIAIDLRGHGESEGGPNGFLKFSDLGNQKSIFDLAAAADYLKNRGAAPEKIVFIGASIGANLSLQMITNLSAGKPEYKTAVLLSPGLDYRGIKADPLVKKLIGGRKIFFISAKDDDRSDGNNAEMNRKLYDLTPADVDKKIQIYDNGGHGTDILSAHPELKNLILQFIQ